MLWLSRPPYLRWLAASLVLALGFLIELRPQDTTPVPVATTEMAAGAAITESDVVWKQGPVELFAEVALPAYLTRSVNAGTLILAADLAEHPVAAPADWWSLELAVPPSTESGTAVLAVVTSEGQSETYVGLTTAHLSDDGFGEALTLVAFSQPDAIRVAAGMADGQVTLLIAG